MFHPSLFLSLSLSLTLSDPNLTLISTITLPNLASPLPYSPLPYPLQAVQKCCRGTSKSAGAKGGGATGFGQSQLAKQCLVGVGGIPRDRFVNTPCPCVLLSACDIYLCLLFMLFRNKYL